MIRNRPMIGYYRVSESTLWLLREVTDACKPSWIEPDEKNPATMCVYWYFVWTTRVEPVTEGRTLRHYSVYEMSLAVSHPDQIVKHSMRRLYRRTSEIVNEGQGYGPLKKYLAKSLDTNLSRKYWSQERQYKRFENFQDDLTWHEHNHDFVGYLR